MRVRPVAAADRPQWFELWHSWQRHMGGAVPDATSEEAWIKLQEPGSGLHCVVAEVSERLRGFAIFSITPFAWTGSPVVFLQDLFVGEVARGMGVGEALLMGVYDFADSQGASNVFWFVDEDDARLQGFYDRHATRTPYLRYMRKPWPF